MMSIADFIYKFFPEKYFKALRKVYYRINKIVFPPMSEEDFKKFLQTKLGVKQDMTVYIHSSADKLNISFSPYRLLQILIETVGEEGTLLFPCWHYRGRAEDYYKNDRAFFSVKKSPTTMGLLPELARRHKSAVRSLHPTASTAGIGAKAAELLSEHHMDIYPNGEKSPMYKMMKYNSKIIGLGEKTVSLSFVHVVEDIMKNGFPVQTLSDNTIQCKVIDNEGNEKTVNTLVPHKNISNRDIPGFFAKNISKEACHSFKYRGSNFFSANPRLLFDELKSYAEKGKTIYKH